MEKSKLKVTKKEVVKVSSTKKISQKDKSYIFVQEPSTNGTMQSKIICLDTEKLELTKITKPQGMYVVNFMGCVRVSKEMICLTGGLNYNCDTVYKFLQFYNPVKNENIPKCDMSQERYNFPLVHFRDHLFALGGRTYGETEDAVLSKCEKYDFKTDTWSDIAPMNKSRSCFKAFVYNEKIWVIAGDHVSYTDHHIENYDFDSDKWEEMSFGLPIEVHSYEIFSRAKNTQLIIGGSSVDYSTSIHKLNLEKETIITESNLKDALSPSVTTEDSNKNLIILGKKAEDLSMYCGVLKKKTKEIEKKSQKNPQYISDWAAAKAANYTITVNYEPIEANIGSYPEDQNFDDITCVLGTDADPYIVSVNKNTCLTKIKGSPLKLRQKNLMGCCKINSHTILCAGGINKSFNRISNHAYIYNIKENTVVKTQNMVGIRYTFPTIYFKGYVYAIGGREFGDDNNAIKTECERLNVNTLVWDNIASMPEPRCSSVTFIINDRLYVAGGFTKTKTRCNSVACYDDIMNNWLYLGISLPNGLEATVTMVRNSEIYFLSGREDPGHRQHNQINRQKRYFWKHFYNHFFYSDFVE